MKKKIIKSNNSTSTNFKNKKQRLNLYARTFRIHSVPSQLFTLQREALELGLSSAAFALDTNDKNYHKLCESVGDIETMIESLKQTLTSLAENSANIKEDKLNRLKTRTDETEAKAKEEPAEEAKKTELDKAIEEKAEAVLKPKQKSFLEKLMFWKD